MTQAKQITQISDTAFLTSWERSLNPELSKDLWSKLWVTDATKQFGKTFIEKVSPNDATALCLRNRYFLDSLLAAEKLNPNFIFLNIAAGFTMYPFLLGEGHMFIEIDYPHVVDFKKKKLREFKSKENLPDRNIQFLAMDLNEIKSHEKIAKLLEKQNNKGTFFVLLEGVLYYLEKRAVDSLMTLLERMLPKKSRIGLVALSNDVKDSKAVASTKDYFEKKLGFSKQNYTWLDEEYFRQLQGFRVLEKTNYAELEKKYCQKPKGMTPENVIFETLYLLEKV